MKVVFYINNLPHQRVWMGAVRDSLEARGVDCPVYPLFVPCPDADAYVVWSWNHKGVIDYAIVNNIPVIYMERGFLPPKTEYTSIAFNGFNNRGKFMEPQDEERMLNWDLAPWKYSGKHTLILGEHPKNADLYGEDVDAWSEAMIRAVDTPLYRPHPLRKTPLPPLCNPSFGSLEADLMYSEFALTYGSNAGVEAILAGVPTSAVDRGSLVWEVSSRDLKPIYPDRVEWLHRMSWKQYTLKELKNPRFPVYDFLLGEIECHNTTM